MAFKDARGWIAKLESEGELRRVKAQVDWNEEIGEIMRRMDLKHGPALLFENINGYGKGRCTKLFAGSAGSRKRMAMMLGLPFDISRGDIVRFLRERFKQLVKPITVKAGPVKENIIMGRDVDLFEFPVPKWHTLDGGRYINTYCGVVTKDPDTEEYNVGLYRGMILGKDKIGVFLVPAQHWGIHYSKYKAMGKPMPVAIVYNWDPVMELVAGNSIIASEYEVMGALRGEPVDLIKCETSDLEVPATAEIVVEGSISPDPNAYEEEGPFGEVTSYYGEKRKRPVINVECITHRNDPIFRGQREGVSGNIVSEGVYVAQYGYLACAWNTLESQGVPGIVDIALGNTTRVKIRKLYQGHAKRVATALWSSQSSVDMHKIVIVVEEDVDIHNLREVESAIATNVNPARDLTVFPGSFGNVLDMSLSKEDSDELAYGAGNLSRLLIDATINWIDHPRHREWGNKRISPKATEPSLETKELVDRRWQEYGI